MGSSAVLETEFRYLAGPRNWMACSLGEVVAAEVARGFPVREFPTYRGQRNYPGWLWLSTTRSLVGTRACLSETVSGWRTSIPTCRRCRVSRSGVRTGRSRLQRHVPDFLLKTTTGFVVIDVKPAELVNDADIAAGDELDASAV